MSCFYSSESSSFTLTIYLRLFSSSYYKKNKNTTRCRKRRWRSNWKIISFFSFVYFISCEFFLLWIVKSCLSNVVCVCSFECSKTFSMFRRRIECVRTRLILTFCSTCLITRSIYTTKVSNSFFFQLSQHYCKSFFKMWWLNFFFDAFVKKKTYLFNDDANKLSQRFVDDFIDFKCFVWIDFVNNFYYFVTCHRRFVIDWWKIIEFCSIFHEYC